MLFALGYTGLATAEDTPDWNADTLTGDWGGARSRLYGKGVTLDMTHKSDYLSNTSGGMQTGSIWLANTELAISVDLNKHIGWVGASAFIQYHAQHGSQSKDFNGSYVGSFAGVDNIETGATTGQFFQLWLQKNSADDRFSLLGGLYAIDSEFYVTETSGLFLQPPYGMSAEMAQTGPPIFPMGALGLRLKYSGDSFYMQGAITDGVPGDPNKPYGTHIKLDKADGSLSVVELGYANEEGSIGKTSLGVWNYTTPIADLDPLISEPRSNQGFYVLAEHMLHAEQGNPGQGLSSFIRAGTVNKDAYQADWSGSAGLHYLGLFDGRDGDEAGIAVTTSHASDKYRQLKGSDSSETVIEISYRAQLLSGIALQPSLQRIINPNMDKAVGDATVVGVRLELAL